MQDKRIALVTGANQGVGFQVANALVTKGVGHQRVRSDAGLRFSGFPA